MMPMNTLLDTISASTHVADRRRRFESAAHDRRVVVGAVTAALISAKDRLRHGRDPAGVLVALPATASATHSDDGTATSWSPERVA